MPSGGRLADLGCGNARLLKIIKHFGDPPWHLVSVDISNKTMQILRKNGIGGELC